MQKNKIIIIGSGISGISAAFFLAKKGFNIELFETKNFIGGRMYSFKCKSNNEYIDNGQHLFMSAYDNFLELLKNLGTYQNLKIQDKLDIKFYSKNQSQSRLSSYPFSGKIGMLFALLKMNNLSNCDKINAIYLMMKLVFIKSLQKPKTVIELLKSNRQKENIINNFWQPLCLAVLNLDVNEADADLFIQVVKKAFFTSKNNSKLIFPTANLSELISPFPEWLNNQNGKIYFNSRVNKILINNNKVSGIEVNGKLFTADYYISTVQANILDKLLDNNLDLDLSEQLKEYEYSTIISLYLWLDGEIIDEDFAALLGTKTQWIFNLNKIQKRVKSDKFLYALTISNADELDDLSNSKIIKICWNELIDIFPKANNLKILDYIVNKNKSATFKANPIIASKRLNTDIGLNNFFIAGDWTNTALPATIEGACISGINAGRIIYQKSFLH